MGTYNQTLHGHWFREGLVWVCKWANLVNKQQSYVPWLILKTCFSSISLEQMNGFSIKFWICIYMNEILVWNIMCCFSFISNEVMALDLSEIYLCSVPCEIINGSLAIFSTRINIDKKDHHTFFIQGYDPWLMSVDNKRSPSKLDTLLLSSLLFLIMGRRPLFCVC